MTALAAQPHTGGRLAALHAERTCTLINSSESTGRYLHPSPLSYMLIQPAMQHICGPLAFAFADWTYTELLIDARLNYNTFNVQSKPANVLLNKHINAWTYDVNAA